MNRLIYLALVSSLFVTCKGKRYDEMKKVVPEFNLITDLYDFKQKMTESDTLRISFDHSGCTNFVYERIEVTKKKDSIKIVSSLKKEVFSKHSVWKEMYDRNISENDHIWKFEEFLCKNEKRKQINKSGKAALVLTNKKDTIFYVAHGRYDLFLFMEDYYETMKKIFPENNDGIYGLDVPQRPN